MDFNYFCDHSAGKYLSHLLWFLYNDSASQPPKRAGGNLQNVGKRQKEHVTDLKDTKGKTLM